MNIFALRKNSRKAVIDMIDKHIVKMPTESCQMLHTNALHYQFVCEKGFEPTLRQLKDYHTEIGSHLMKPAMLNHPSTIWARESPANFKWLYDHATAMCEEYTYRYGKIHGSERRIYDTPLDFLQNDGELTPLRIAMDDKYRLDRLEYFEQNPNHDEWDFVVDSYRHYYREAKWKFAEWRKNRQPIDWFPLNWYAKKYNVGVRLYNAKKPRYPMVLLEE